MRFDQTFVEFAKDVFSWCLILVGALVLLLNFSICTLAKTLHQLFIVFVFLSVRFHVAFVVLIDFRNFTLALFGKVCQVPVSLLNIFFDFKIDHFRVVNADWTLQGFGSHNLVDKVHC